MNLNWYTQVYWIGMCIQKKIGLFDESIIRQPYKTLFCISRLHKMISKPLPVYYVVLQIRRNCWRLNTTGSPISLVLLELKPLQVWERRRILCAPHYIPLSENLLADDLLGLGNNLWCSFIQHSLHTCYLPDYTTWTKADRAWLYGIYLLAGETDINQMFTSTSVNYTCNIF